MRCIKWFVYFVSITFISLMLQACGGGGGGSTEYNYEIGAITDVGVFPILEEITDPESGETIYITDAEEIHIIGDVSRLSESYTEACSEVEDLEPLLLTVTWDNLTTGVSGTGEVNWHTTYGSLWHTCSPQFQLTATLTDGLNTIEITVTNEDGYYAKEQVQLDKQ